MQDQGCSAYDASSQSSPATATPSDASMHQAPTGVAAAATGAAPIPEPPPGLTKAERAKWHKANPPPPKESGTSEVRAPRVQKEKTPKQQTALGASGGSVSKKSIDIELQPRQEFIAEDIGRLLSIVEKANDHRQELFKKLNTKKKNHKEAHPKKQEQAQRDVVEAEAAYEKVKEWEYTLKPEDVPSIDDVLLAGTHLFKAVCKSKSSGDDVESCFGLEDVVYEDSSLDFLESLNSTYHLSRAQKFDHVLIPWDFDKVSTTKYKEDLICTFCIHHWKPDVEKRGVPNVGGILFGKVTEGYLAPGCTLYYKKTASPIGSTTVLSGSRYDQVEENVPLGEVFSLMYDDGSSTAREWNDLFFAPRNVLLTIKVHLRPGIEIIASDPSLKTFSDPHSVKIRHVDKPAVQNSAVMDQLCNCIDLCHQLIQQHHDSLDEVYQSLSGKRDEMRRKIESGSVFRSCINVHAALRRTLALLSKANVVVIADAKLLRWNPSVHLRFDDVQQAILADYSKEEQKQYEEVFKTFIWPGIPDNVEQWDCDLQSLYACLKGSSKSSPDIQAMIADFFIENASPLTESGNKGSLLTKFRMFEVDREPRKTNVSVEFEISQNCCLNNGLITFKFPQDFFSTPIETITVTSWQPSDHKKVELKDQKKVNFCSQFFPSESSLTIALQEDIAAKATILVTLNELTTGSAQQGGKIEISTNANPPMTSSILSGPIRIDRSRRLAIAYVICSFACMKSDDLPDLGAIYSFNALQSKAVEELLKKKYPKCLKCKESRELSSRATYSKLFSNKIPLFDQFRSICFQNANPNQKAAKLWKRARFDLLEVVGDCKYSVSVTFLPCKRLIDVIKSNPNACLKACVQRCNGESTSPTSLNPSACTKDPKNAFGQLAFFVENFVLQITDSSIVHLMDILYDETGEVLDSFFIEFHDKDGLSQEQGCRVNRSELKQRVKDSHSGFPFLFAYYRLDETCFESSYSFREACFR